MRKERIKWLCPNDGTSNDDEIDEQDGPFITCTCDSCGKSFGQFEVKGLTRVVEAESES